jgi:hypothetical protein
VADPSATSAAIDLRCKIVRAPVLADKVTGRCLSALTGGRPRGRMTVVKDILTRSYGCAAMAGARHEGCANGVGVAAVGPWRQQRIDSDANRRPLTGISDSGSLGFRQSAHAPAHRRADRRAKTFAQAAWS